MCTVRPTEGTFKEGKAPKFKFEIITVDQKGKRSLILQADTDKERQQWIKAIQDAISSSLTQTDLDDVKNKFSSNALSILHKIPGNSSCADCDAPGKKSNA